MYRDFPFFRSTIELMEMALAKADAGIAAHYDRHLVPDDQQDLGAMLRERLQRAIDAVIDVTGHQQLLADNPVLRRSIDVRNPYVDPINLLQVELLRRLRATPRPARRGDRLAAPRAARDDQRRRRGDAEHGMRSVAKAGHSVGYFGPLDATSTRTPSAASRRRFWRSPGCPT